MEAFIKCINEKEMATMHMRRNSEWQNVNKCVLNKMIKRVDDFIASHRYENTGALVTNPGGFLQGTFDNAASYLSDSLKEQHKDTLVYKELSNIGKKQGYAKNVGLVFKRKAPVEDISELSVQQRWDLLDKVNDKLFPSVDYLGIILQRCLQESLEEVTNSKVYTVKVRHCTDEQRMWGVNVTTQVPRIMYTDDKQYFLGHYNYSFEYNIEISEEQNKFLTKVAELSDELVRLSKTNWYTDGRYCAINKHKWTSMLNIMSSLDKLINE